VTGRSEGASAAGTAGSRDGGPAVSIIIPAYADTPRLRRAMWSVCETADLPHELIVACAPQSVAKNRNAGLDRARHDLVAFLDDDVLLPARWLSRLHAVLLARPDAGAVTGLFTFPNGCPQTRRPDLAPGELWQVTIPGTCFLYSRARVGDQRFDEGYAGSQWEDTDWMWAVQGKGLVTLACGDVRAIHDHTLRENQHLQANMARFLEKWGKLPGPEDTYAIAPETYAAWRVPPLPGAAPLAAPT
jgi:hypothetical protein